MGPSTARQQTRDTVQLAVDSAHIAVDSAHKQTGAGAERHAVNVAVRRNVYVRGRKAVRTSSEVFVVAQQPILRSFFLATGQCLRVGACAQGTVRDA